MAKPSLSYCAREVRRLDHDRYLAALFAPQERREALFALYAFNQEIARIPELVSESLLGHIRLQWWRDAIEGIYRGAPVRHAVVEPLAHAIETRSLSRGEFDRLLEIREFDLEQRQPEDLAELESYVEGTTATLARLGLEALDARTPATETAARHGALGFGLTGLLRAVPFHARQRRCYLPRDVAQDARLDPDSLYALKSSEALRRACATIAGRADEHLAQARAQRGAVGRSGAGRAARPVLLWASLAHNSLERLRRARFDPFDPGVQAPAPGRVWRLAWRHWTGRY
ncbi:MAG TPA: phytoene/squalene synthase family protein [Kiloniellales bacterium]|nr:phytoene/squalene synthase family protein [Kiloniellales bacterium]